MVVSLPFTVNLCHDGLFQVNPLEYVHFDSRVIDDVSFDGMSFKDFFSTIRRLVLVTPASMYYKVPSDPITALKLLKNDEDLGQFVKACYGNNLKIDLFTKHNGYDIMKMIHEDLHPKKPVGHVDSALDGETNVPLDDVAHVVEHSEHKNEGNVNIPRIATDDPWLNKLVGNGTFIGQTDNPNPNLPDKQTDRYMMSSVNHDDLAHLKITLISILSATNNFDEENLTETADFGNAYTGQLLWSEISLLSTLKHKNVVSLVGFCDENDENIIVTKFETWLSLDNYLSDAMMLTWVRRLEICVGIANALSYIHYDEAREFSVIHRNIDSLNVLLNDDYEPKLSEFRLSLKIEASQRHHSFGVDKVREIEGYTDPTYTETKTANHKSDIYSFGIVMFELLCGRKAVINEDQDNKYLAPMAILHYREEKLEDIVEWNLWKQIDPQSFKVFTEIAYACLKEERSQRPDINEIITKLEKALELARVNQPLQQCLAYPRWYHLSSVIEHRRREKGECAAVSLCAMMCFVSLCSTDITEAREIQVKSEGTHKVVMCVRGESSDSVDAVRSSSVWRLMRLVYELVISFVIEENGAVTSVMCEVVHTTRMSDHTLKWC
ncbi:kinase-like domain, phloem protein 2-like protein [Tanacetum coccineum]